MRKMRKVTVEEFKKEWLTGTTCRHHQWLGKLIFWKSEDERFIIAKHHGHATAKLTRVDPTAWCGTEYKLIDLHNIDGQIDFDTISHLKIWEGRWKKANMEEALKIISDINKVKNK